MVFVSHSFSLSLSNVNTYSGSLKFSEAARMRSVSCSRSCNDRAALNHRVGISVTTGEEDLEKYNIVEKAGEIRPTLRLTCST